MFEMFAISCLLV